MYLKYKGKIYVVEGCLETDGPTKYFMCCFLVKGGTEEQNKEYLWKTYKASLHECAQEFLEQPILEGQKLAEIERDVEWVDDELG